MAPTPDDASILDDASLIRRIPPDLQIYDENLGRYRPTSHAFDNHRDGTPMSAQLTELVIANGGRPEDALRGYDKTWGLVEFSAGFARSQKQGVVADPRPEDPAHVHVHGKKTRAVKRAFAKQCGWAVTPSGA